MTSYYKKIEGNLKSGEVARVEDILNIQDSIEQMISNSISDLFGNSFILNSGKDDLKLQPTSSSIDQFNLPYDTSDNWISFYGQYLRQKIIIEKSEIASISVWMKNTSSIEKVNVFAEIRDSSNNILDEATSELPYTDNTEGTEITFNFKKCKHINAGTYYFVIRSLDMNGVEFDLNTSSNIDYIDSDMFLVKYDVTGKYNQGLYISDNGLDYIESKEIGIYDQNGDLYFKHTFSRGNTYLVNPGIAIINGQQVIPVDTHVTIKGPSPIGDRVDLVYLGIDGSINVISGPITQGTKKEYPTLQSTGLKLAYITLYKTTNENWTCPECGTLNNIISPQCINCKAEPDYNSTKIPLIEQDDDNSMTRTRDVLERIRRLEKKLDYDIERNSPNRIKYNLTIPAFMEPSDESYEISYVINEKGETVATSELNNTESHQYWTIKQHKENERWVINSTTTTEKPSGVFASLKYAPSSSLTKTKSFLEVYPNWKNSNKTIDLTTKKSPSPTVVGAQGKKTQITAGNVITTKNSNAIYTATLVDLTTNSPISSQDITFTVTKPTGKSEKDIQKEVDAAIKKAQSKLKSNATANEKKAAAQKAEKTVRNKYKSQIQTFNIKTNNNGEAQFKINYDIIGAYKVKIEYKSANTTRFLNCTFSKKEYGHIFIDTAAQLNKHKNDKIGSTKTNTTLDYEAYDAFYEGELGLYSEETKDKFITAVEFDETTTEGYRYVGDANFSKNGISIDTRNGIASLSTTSIDDEDMIISLNASEYEQSNQSYKVSNQGNSSFPALNFKLKRNTIIQSINIKDISFKNISKYSLILFKNSDQFNISDLSKMTYTKMISKGKDDPIFPTISEVEYNLTNQNTIKDTNKQIITPQPFIINKMLEAGNYTILIHAEPINDKGEIYLKQYKTNNAVETYGAATTCIGNKGDSVALQSNKTSEYSWNIEIYGSYQDYVQQGTLISDIVSVDFNIQKVKMLKKVEIPDGSNITFWVSNNGGRDYTQINDEPITFSGTGKNFQWKAVFTSNGKVSPMIKYNDNGGEYAIAFILQDSGINYLEDVELANKTCFTTQPINATEIINKILPISIAPTKGLSAWEYVRIWTSDDDKSSKIDIHISDDLRSTPSKTIYGTILTDLTLDDFSQTSVDYSNYNADVEYDEYNYRFKLETDNFINESKTICNGLDADLGNINSKIGSDAINTDDFVYNTINIGENRICKAMTYHPQVYREEGTYINKTSYLCSGDEIGGKNYNPKAILIGKTFPNGINIGNNYQLLTIDLFPQFNTLKDSDTEREIPSDLFEIVISLNVNGMIDEEDAYAGKAYPITQKLINNQHNYIEINNFIGVDYNGEDIRAIGIRIRDQTESNNGIYNTMHYNPQSESGDSIGICGIYATSQNITELISKTNTDRLTWHPIDGAISNDSNSAAIIKENINDSVLGNDKLGDTVFVDEDWNITGEASIDFKNCVNKTKDEIYKGNDYIEYNRFIFDDKDELGEIFQNTLKKPINLDSYNMYHIAFSLNTAINKGEILINFYDENEDGEQEKVPFETLTIPHVNMINNDNAGPKESINKNEINSTIDSEIYQHAIFYKRAPEGKTLRHITLERKDPRSKKDGSQTNNDVIHGRVINIHTIEAYTSNYIPAMGDTIQMRWYPDLTQINQPTLRKYGAIFTLQ